MAKAPTIPDVASGYASTQKLQTIFESIESSFENTLSLDGSTPNAMQADLDMGGNDIINAGEVNADRVFIGGNLVTDAVVSPSWRGAWAAAINYTVNNLVKRSGGTYICLVDHTSGATFTPDLTAGKWDTVAEKGATGAGTGDLLASNNLSDVSSKALSRTNLGLGSAAEKDTSFFVTSANIPSQTQAVWNTGTSTTESLVSPAKLDDKIENKLNISGTAPIYGVRAWCKFNGTGTPAVTAGGNVDSITDNGVGDYTVNFTTAMPNADYAAAITAGGSGAGANNIGYIVSQTTSTLRIRLYDSGPGLNEDASTVTVIVVC